MDRVDRKVICLLVVHCAFRGSTWSASTRWTGHPTSTAWPPSELSLPSTGRCVAGLTVRPPSPGGFGKLPGLGATRLGSSPLSLPRSRQATARDRGPGSASGSSLQEPSRLAFTLCVASVRRQREGQTEPRESLGATQTSEKALGPRWHPGTPLSFFLYLHPDGFTFLSQLGRCRPHLELEAMPTDHLPAL